MTAYDERSGYKERLEKAEAERDFYAKDAATAWDKCEERRLQAEKAEAELAKMTEEYKFVLSIKEQAKENERDG